MGRVTIYGHLGSSLSRRIANVSRSLDLDVEERDYAEQVRRWSDDLEGLSEEERDRSVAVLLRYIDIRQLPIVWMEGHALSYAEARERLVKMATDDRADAGGP